MGRPINKKYFGSDATNAQIKVHYWDGVGNVAGYIVKQLGAKKFRCAGGAAQKDCLLVGATATSTLHSGFSEMTVTVTDDAAVSHFATKVSAHKVTYVVTGVNYSMPWSFTASTTDSRVEMDEAGGGYGPVINIVDAEDGILYEIVVPGTTDFTLFGAGDSNIGTQFTMSSAPGTGTGTVKEVL